MSMCSGVGTFSSAVVTPEIEDDFPASLVEHLQHGTSEKTL